MSDKTLITAHSGSDGTRTTRPACVRYAFRPTQTRSRSMCAARTERSRSATMPPTIPRRHAREVLASPPQSPACASTATSRNAALNRLSRRSPPNAAHGRRLIFSGSVDVNAPHPELHDCAEVYSQHRVRPRPLPELPQHSGSFELTAAEIITRKSANTASRRSILIECHHAPRFFLLKQR